jgi:hypothetical protein
LTNKATGTAQKTYFSASFPAICHQTLLAETIEKLKYRLIDGIMTAQNEELLHGIEATFLNATKSEDTTS